MNNSNEESEYSDDDSESEYSEDMSDMSGGGSDGEWAGPGQQSGPSRRTRDTVDGLRHGFHKTDRIR